MVHLDLFSGIGGAALAVEAVWPQAEHIFVEKDPYCRALLHKRFPNSYIHGDIRTFGLDTYPNGDGRADGQEEKHSTKRGQQALDDPSGRDRTFTANSSLEYDPSRRCGSGEQFEKIKKRETSRLTNGNENTKRVDKKEIYILTGGFPCQPFSQAGRRKGTSDDRYLWPEMLRVIREFRPRWVVGENVAGLLTIEQGVVLKQIIADLESEGYEVQCFVIPAVAVNAPHRRDRVWIVANRTDGRQWGGEQERHSGRQQETQIGSGDRNGGNTGRKGLSGIRKGEQPFGLQNVERASWNENWLEVATRFCGMDARLSDWLDRFMNDVVEWDYAFHNSNEKQALQVLFKAIQSPEIREKVGGLWKVDEEEILLETVRQLQKRVGKPERIHVQGEAVQKSKMRVLPEYEFIGRASQGRRHNAQLAQQLADIVQELPYETALEVVEAGAILWGAYTAIYSQAVELDGLKLSKSKHRAERLKGLGNAWVPQVVAEIFRAVQQADLSTGGVQAP